MSSTFSNGVNNLSLFWRILVDPCCAEDLRDVVKKEVALWGQDDEGNWYRFLNLTFKGDHLPVTAKCDKNSPNAKAEIMDCLLYLTDCFLEVKDPGLSKQAEEMGKDLGKMLLPSNPVEVTKVKKDVEEFLSHIASGMAPPDSNCNQQTAGEEHGDVPKGSEEFGEEEPFCQFEVLGGKLYYVGENIRLESEFTADSDTPAVHSVFFYPKFHKLSNDSTESGSINLRETLKGTGDREALWTISPTEYLSDPYYLSGQHLLIVSQDQNFQSGTIFNKQRYFEFLVDTVPIRPPENDDEVHLFWTGEETFYIGFIPGSPGLLQGSIKRIMFDPHSSCYGC
jgi:hypothetical protein